MTHYTPETCSTTEPFSSVLDENGSSNGVGAEGLLQVGKHYCSLGGSIYSTHNIQPKTSDEPLCHAMFSPDIRQYIFLVQSRF